MAKAPRASSKAPNALAIKELGSTQFGVPAFGNRIDLIPMLGNEYGILTAGNYLELLKMTLTDETVGAVFWCIRSTLMQVDFTYSPQIDGKDAPNDPKAKKAADFANGLLDDMAHTMGDHIEEALEMLTYGFAPCEIVLKQRDGVQSRFKDMAWGIDSVPLRSQLSVSGWDWNGSKIAAMRQYTSNTPIPYWKLLHYRVNAPLNNPYGRSFLTNAYRIWKLKCRIQDSEAIGIDRDLAGLPIFRMPQEILDAADETDANGDPTPEATKAINVIQSAMKSVRDMRFREQDGLILASDTFASDDPESKDRTRKFDFTMMTGAGPRTIDTRGPIRDYDMGIARVLLMQFLQLGTKAGGSYGLSSDQSETAYASLIAIVNKVVGEWNRKVTPLIWLMNSLDPKTMPVLKAGDFDKEGMQAIGDLLNGIGRAQALWETDAKMRGSMADMAGFDYDADAQEAAAQQAAKSAAAPPAPNPFMMGHNGGPPIDDKTPTPKPAVQPKTEEDQ